MEKKGIFIVAEGGEGSGKTTVLKHIYNRLSLNPGSEHLVLTREPGGTPLADQIRHLLLHGAGKPSIKTELLLFCAARADHCDKVIRPALKAGKIVLCDRFDGSTDAYQIYGRQRAEYKSALEKINAFARGRESGEEITPNLVLFFDVEVKTGLERTLGRNEKQSNFDVEAFEFHQRVRNGFLLQCENNPNWARIDANRELLRVQFQAWKTVEAFLYRWRKQ